MAETDAERYEREKAEREARLAEYPNEWDLAKSTGSTLPKPLNQPADQPETAPEAPAERPQEGTTEENQ